MSQNNNFRERKGGQKPQYDPQKDFDEFIEESFGKSNVGELVKYLLTKPQTATDIDKYLESVDGFVSKNQKDITISQLRNIYYDIKKVELSQWQEVKMLQVQIAYIAGRHEGKQGQKMRFFCELLIKMIKDIDGQDKFVAFTNFFEMVIAYHKYRKN